MRTVARPRRPERGRGRALIALAGTPGTGKSAVARRLGGSPRFIEVGDLARRLGCARGRGRGVEVDLERLSRRISEGAAPEVEVVVGHLAHLLPVRRVILLRCDPVELARRLGRARRGRPRDRAENALAEALDVLRVEAARLRRPVAEVDTTGRPVAAVAREVAGLLSGRPRRRPPRVDWLAEPGVTDYLLRHGP